MTADRWQRLNDLFHAAVALAPGERDAFLDGACGDDPGLRAEVEGLVAAHGQAGRFIDSPAYLAVGGGDAREPSPIGRRFGAYRAIEVVGRGGMGAVFLAERADGQFAQRVAIKVIKRGMDTEAVLDRFRAERRILASLEHPNIARLLDGGTTDDGRPYFVMEYVAGMPIDRYAEQKGLSVRERLALVLQVCRAVGCAHQRLIIHRDIKPLNILVTPDGTPKLLDFGIAKVLDPDEELPASTLAGQQLLTPEYASPEQVDGRPVTTQSDIYSLGVVLYQLLTGRLPHPVRARTPVEIAEAVRRVEPERPSLVAGQAAAAGARALRRQLRGDLDTIVLTALQKDPARRYATVEQLAEDLERHLDGRPVLARGDSIWYRGARFARRNRLAVTAAALVALALVGGTIGTAWQAREAREQARRAAAAQERAERRFADVRRLANAVLFEYHDAIRDLPGATPVRERLVRDALGYLNALAGEAQDDLTLQRDLARAYQKVGDVQGGSTVASLGDTTGAIDSYDRARQILEGLLRADPADLPTRRALADVYAALGTLVLETGDVRASLAHARQARAHLDAAAAGRPIDLELRLALSRADDLLGMLAVEAGQVQDALDLHRADQRRLESASESERQDPRLRRALSVAHQHLGDALVQAGDLTAALENTRRALALREALAADFPENADYRRIVLVSRYYEAEILSLMGRTREALARYRRNYRDIETLARADPSNEQYRSGLAFDVTRVADMLARLGDHEEALVSYRRALAVREEEWKADPPNLWKRMALIESHARICRTEATLGRPSAADTCARTAEMMEATAVAPDNAGYRGYLAGAYTDLAAIYEGLARSCGTPPAERPLRWRTAGDLHRRSREIWTDMTSRGIVAPADTGRVGDAERAVARTAAPPSDAGRCRPAGSLQGVSD